MRFIQKAAFITSIGVLVALTGCDKSAEEGKKAIMENTANPFSPDAQTDKPGSKPASGAEPANQGK